MNENEYLIVEEIYFLTSFQQLIQTIGCSEETLEKDLAHLLSEKMITQFVFDEYLNDYVVTEPVDFSILRKSAFVATKKGLLEHHNK